MDRGVGDRVHRVPEERGAGVGEEAVPRRPIRPIGPGERPGEEGDPPVGGDQARSPGHGGVPWVRSSGGGDREGPAQQLGHAPERSPPHHHH
ncbi:unnamed protein product [Linum tenue]|uniref:Uncharacterized protein n=1 Tax=Linum tenue TaxID=586396 RepID=A0AAV0PKR5_9ROSI|nr:unnamed protein product [Linum tenue]